MGRLRTGVWAGAAGLAVAVAAAAGIGLGGTRAQPSASAGAPTATARVTRTTLVQTERVSGVLGYGRQITVVARAGTGGAAPGTLTWLPEAGAIVRAGQPVYRIDERPVVLLVGGTPLYRPLTSGEEGGDVRELEENLRSFGYTGFGVDSSFTAATAGAVRRWQRDLGLETTGTVTVDQAVVAPAELRVVGRRVELGAAASGPVLTCTGTTRAVSVALDVAMQHLVRPGLAATVTLPDRRTVAGIVAAVGTVATRPTTGQSTSTTIDVTLTIADQAALGALDEAPVDVDVVTDRRAGVLVVPVGALVALPEGSYAVQVVQGSHRRYEPVQTGLFAAGMVEVSSPGISEGTTVVVPA